MEEWYGLKINGVLTHVIRWPAGGRPTVFDFKVPILSGTEYQVAPVWVQEAIDP